MATKKTVRKKAGGAGGDGKVRQATKKVVQKDSNEEEVMREVTSLVVTSLIKSIESAEKKMKFWRGLSFVLFIALLVVVLI